MYKKLVFSVFVRDPDVLIPRPGAGGQIITPGGSIEQMFGGGSYPLKFPKNKKGVNTNKNKHLRKIKSEKVSKERC